MSDWERAASDYHRTSETELHRLRAANEALLAEVEDLRGRLARAFERIGAQSEIITRMVERQNGQQQQSAEAPDCEDRSLLPPYGAPTPAGAPKGEEPGA